MLNPDKQFKRFPPLQQVKMSCCLQSWAGQTGPSECCLWGCPTNKAAKAFRGLYSYACSHSFPQRSSSELYKTSLLYSRKYRACDCSVHEGLFLPIFTCWAALWAAGIVWRAAVLLVHQNTVQGSTNGSIMCLNPISAPKVCITSTSHLSSCQQHSLAVYVKY